jgi:hypothetical protein
MASYLSSSAKIQKLYGITNSFARSSDNSARQDRSVCITYGGWTNRSIHEATAWYIRDSHAQTQEPIEIARSITDSHARTGTTSKKRKIRAGKQMDVASLLGAFR